MYDVAIIGAGVTGASIARRLSSYDLDILVLEQCPDISQGSSKANTGIVHGGYAEPHEELRGRICYKGRKKFDELDEELNFGFIKNGSLVVGFDENDKEELEKLYQRGLENGLDDIRIIEQTELQELEPNINPDAKYALYCEGAGIISPYEYVVALMENAVDNGVTLKLNQKVTDITKDDYFEITTEDNTYKAKYVINATGLNGAEISKLIATTDFDIHARSGEYLIMNRGSGEKLNHSLFPVPTEKSKGIMVAPTLHNSIIIGPDAIEETRYTQPDTHIDRLTKVFIDGHHTVADEVLDIDEYIRSFAGLRTVSSTGDFIIEESDVEGFINVVGIQSPGITSSPIIAQMVEEILEDSGLELTGDPSYDPHREPIFREVDYRPFKKIRDDLERPADDPERIVCRCQQVKQSIITDAISRSTPVQTVDGVKRRTYASTGICQGQFCRSRVIETLEHYDNPLYDELTDVERTDVERVDKKTLVDAIKGAMSE